MKIKFTTSFTEIAQKGFGITREDVLQTVEDPIRKQLLVFNGLKLNFFLRKEEKKYLHSCDGSTARYHIHNP